MISAQLHETAQKPSAAVQREHCGERERERLLQNTGWLSFTAKQTVPFRGHFYFPEVNMVSLYLCVFRV